MSNSELEKIKEQYIAILEKKLNDLLLSRSSNNNKIQQMQENFTICGNFLNDVINKLANEFVDELNSDKFSSVSLEEKEKTNDSFRIKTKELVLQYNRKFLLNE